MIRPAVPFLLAALALPLHAQKSLAELQKQCAAEAQKLDAQHPSREQRDQLLGRHAEAVAKFVADDAQGDDRWNGRLMLADLRLARGERDQAVAALKGITTSEAPALLLVTAATMAQHLNLKEQRAEWIAAAVKKDTPLADRLAMARMLTTVLHEVEQGDKLFAQALAAATDDEQRSFVRWHKADALREREDLPDNAAFDELDKLAKELPGTYWGSVAKDRLRATQLKVGDDAIAFQAKTRDDKNWSLDEHRGKVVVLAFFSARDQDTPTLVALLKELEKRHGEQLSVLGICLDRGDLTAGLQPLGLDFPVVADGKGSQGDVALRWFVEGLCVHVVDKAGRIAALGKQARANEGRTELQDAVAAAVKR